MISGSLSGLAAIGILGLFPLGAAALEVGLAGGLPLPPPPPPPPAPPMRKLTGAGSSGRPYEIK